MTLTNAQCHGRDLCVGLQHYLHTGPVRLIPAEYNMDRSLKEGLSSIMASMLVTYIPEGNRDETLPLISSRAAVLAMTPLSTYTGHCALSRWPDSFSTSLVSSSGYIDQSEQGVLSRPQVRQVASIASPPNPPRSPPMPTGKLISECTTGSSPSAAPKTSSPGDPSSTFIMEMSAPPTFISLGMSSPLLRIEPNPLSSDCMPFCCNEDSSDDSFSRSMLARPTAHSLLFLHARSAKNGPMTVAR